MRVAIIEQTNIWQVESYGNGFAYAFYRKSDAASAFLQGDDAAQWRDNYENMRAAACNPDSVWYRQSWNSCLSELCADYVDNGESVINRAADCLDLDSACRIIQDAIGQTQGDIAANYFSDLENESQWRKLSLETRRNRIAGYLETEFQYKESR